MKAGKSQTISSRFLLVIWILSIAAVSYLSLTPKIEFPLDFEKADLMYHSIAYLWIAAMPFFAFQREKTGLVSALLMMVLGVALEVTQIAIPSRVFSALDIGANGVGVIMGILCAKLVRSGLFRSSGAITE